MRYTEESNYRNSSKNNYQRLGKEESRELLFDGRVSVGAIVQI